MGKSMVVLIGLIALFLVCWPLGVVALIIVLMSQVGL